MRQDLEINFKASPHQKEFFLLKTRYRAFIGGIRSGKSYAGAIQCLKLALQKPGCTGMVGGVTYPMINDVIIPIFEEITPRCLIKKFNQNDKVMELINGSKILFRPLENTRQIDRIRGITINWAWIDEGAYLPEYAWKVVQGRLSEGEDQVCLLTTTPKGFTWIHDYFIQKEHGDNYSAVTGVSSDSNPFIPQEFIDDLLQGYTGEYLKQEFYGQFIKFEGLVYLEFEPKKHLIPSHKIKDMDFRDWIYGYDAGYRNPRAFVKIGITHDDKYVITDVFYRKEALLSDSIGEFIEIMGEDNGTVYADPSARGEIEEMNNRGMDVDGADNDVGAGIQCIKDFLDKGNLLISDHCQAVINEINSYRWHDEKDQPIKEDDHSMDALRYAIYTHEGGSIALGTLDNR